MRRKRTIQHWRMCALAATVVTAATTLPLPNNIALAAAPDTARPLGSLFGRTTQGAPQSQGSVLPSDWNRTPTQASQPSAQPAISAPTDGTARPLGTLFNAPKPLSIAGETSTTTQPVPRIQGRQIRPANRVQPGPASNASTTRPLGTLFGAQAPEAPTAAPKNRAPAQTQVSTPAAANTTTSAPAPASPPSDAPNASLNADSMTFDRDLGLITATGRVEVTYAGRTLRAEKVTYNQKTDIVQAFDNVSLTETNGEVMFGERMEITGDLKDGVVYNIGLIMADRTRVAGSGARRSDGRYTDVSNAVYSPCDLCKEDPSRAPIWQLKAVRVTHDATEQQVEYRDAWLEVFGVPVAYTPYFSHPDPTVKRRSGFLAPSFANSSDLGFRLDAPYFWAIDEHQDATLSPLLTTDGGSGMYAEYRSLYRKGEINAQGSFVADDPDRGLRGYIDLESEFHLDPTWRAGANIQASSDDTYMRRYGFETDPVLETRGYIEGFRGRNYQVVNTYAFKDLRAESNADETPLILPMYDFNYVGSRDRLGGFSAFDFNAINLMRDEGVDMRRISFRPRWERPFNGAFGELYTASVSLAADGYHASNVTKNDGSEFSGLSGRIQPRATFAWRLPLVRAGDALNQTVEPQASVTVAPNGGNPDNIPNEDSQEIEFDETNLFRENLYDGIDRVDGGTRINYGVNYVASTEDYGNGAFFIGQSYRPRVSSSFAQASGQDDNFSDVVATVQMSPKRYIDLLYRTQFSPDNLSPQRNELSTQIGGAPLRLNLDYTFIDQQSSSEFGGREEISGQLSSKFNRNWSGSVSALRDLNESEMRSLGMRLVYEDECVRFTTALARSFFEDRDLKPSDTITFTLVLKTLGEISTGVSQGQ